MENADRVVVITSYSIHYTKLYEKVEEEEEEDDEHEEEESEDGDYS